MHNLKREKAMREDKKRYQRMLNEKEWHPLQKSEVLWEGNNRFVTLVSQVASAMASDAREDRGFRFDDGPVEHQTVSSVFQHAIYELFDANVDSPLNLRDFSDQPWMPPRDLIEACFSVECPFPRVLFFSGISGVY